jgi:hypothetical protein
MFPICMTPDGFKDAMRAGRLQGVDPRALAIIDSLQPYHLVENDRRKAPLLILDELTNINKHRHILLTAIRSHITTGMATFEMDGEVWANHGARFDLPIRAEEVPVNAQLVACLALNEGSAKNEEVTTLLNTLAKRVREVVKPFLPFLG